MTEKQKKTCKNSISNELGEHDFQSFHLNRKLSSIDHEVSGVFKTLSIMHGTKYSRMDQVKFVKDNL